MNHKTRSCAALVWALLAAPVHAAGAEANTADITRAVRSGLVANDLRLKGSDLYRKLYRAGQRSHMFQLEDSNTFSRVENEGDALVIEATIEENDDLRGLPYKKVNLLAERVGSRITVSLMQDIEDEPLIGRWRRRGALLLGVGALNLYADSEVSAISVYLRTPAGWSTIQAETDHKEASWAYPSGFVSGSSDDLIVYNRDDEIELPTPHAGPHLTMVTRWRLRDGLYRPMPAHVLGNAFKAFCDLNDAIQAFDWSRIRWLVPEKRLRRQLVRLVATKSTEPTYEDVPGQHENGTAFMLSHWQGNRLHRLSIWFSRKNGRWIATRCAELAE